MWFDLLYYLLLNKSYNDRFVIFEARSDLISLLKLIHKEYLYEIN